MSEEQCPYGYHLVRPRWATTTPCFHTVYITWRRDGKPTFRFEGDGEVLGQPTHFYVCPACGLTWFYPDPLNPPPGRTYLRLEDKTDTGHAR